MVDSARLATFPPASRWREHPCVQADRSPHEDTRCLHAAIRAISRDSGLVEERHWVSELRHRVFGQSSGWPMVSQERLFGESDGVTNLLKQLTQSFPLMSPLSAVKGLQFGPQDRLCRL